MTAIVDPRWFKSKADLKANLDASKCSITDPTPFGDKVYYPETCPVGWSIVVTNPPQRTKFAKITKTANGWKVG